MYEETIQKLESDVRVHLRHQNFLKLHIDTLQNTIETQSRELKSLAEKVKENEEKKLKLRQMHTKEIAAFKAHEAQLGKTMSGLKDKINELNMFITTNNAGKQW